MIKTVANKIIDVFDRNDAMEYDREIYQHGLELILSYLIGFVVQCIFCIVQGFVMEGIFFILFFETLRKYTGGYHANTYLGCNISYLGMFLVYYMALRYVPANTPVLNVFVIISAITILRYSPLEHPHNPLDDMQIVVYRKRAILLLAGYIALYIALYFTYPQYFYALSLILLSVSIMLVAGKYMNGGTRDED